MRIGLDFDNTIVSYDSLFHKVALEKGLIPSTTAQTKLAVRDHLRATGREPIWTEMQGYVYGARMMEAVAFPGLIEFLHNARDMGLSVAIVSHKTQYPFLGPRYDLHQSARQWVEHHLIDHRQSLVAEIYFEPTKEDKLKRIADCNFAVFVDDLPEILSAPMFPAATIPILFDPAGAEIAPPRAIRMADWTAIQSFLGSLCLTN